MTNRSESREDDRADPPTGKRTDAESSDEQTDTEPTGERTDAEPSENDDSGHLDDVEDGAGCTEIWEHLSERREAARREAEQDA